MSIDYEKLPKKDPCPWCHIIPAIMKKPIERLVRVYCDNPECPVKPVGRYKPTNAEAISEGWNWIKKFNESRKKA